MEYTYGDKNLTRGSANVNPKVFIISLLRLYYRTYLGYLVVNNSGIYMLIVTYLDIFCVPLGNILHVLPFKEGATKR